MSQNPENPQAFPSPMSPHPHGMTLRDYFAAKTMAACIIASKDLNYDQLRQNARMSGSGTIGEMMAMAAYDYADAMLKARVE